MARDIQAIETEYRGVVYRSRTEARWAVFLECLGTKFDYEKIWIPLSSGEKYLPDFYIHDFNAYLEVKPFSEEVVSEECIKARIFANEAGDVKVWLAMGAPSSEDANILPLSLWKFDAGIEEILARPENRYQILEDRRDSEVYWLHSKFTDGSFHHSYMIGGPGKSTEHDRLPLMHNTVLDAYKKASCEKF